MKMKLGSVFVWAVVFVTSCMQKSGSNAVENIEKTEYNDIKVKVNDIQLQVRDYQKGEEVIVLLNYGGGNLMQWVKMVPSLKDDYRLILVDLRGHGKSELTEKGYHIDQMAQDVVEVMKYLKLEKAHIIGSSLGGEVALSMGANYPERVISLVLEGALISKFGPYSMWEGSEEEFKKFVFERLERVRNSNDTVYQSLDALLADSEQIYGELWNEDIEQIERHGAYKLGEGRYTTGMGKVQWEDYNTYYYQYRFEDYFKKVKSPILVFGGEGDFESDREINAQKKLLALSSLGGEVLVVNGWRHAYGWLLTPEQITNKLSNFLEKSI